MNETKETRNSMTINLLNPWATLDAAICVIKMSWQARNQGGGHLGHLPPPEIFKTLHSNFDICRNFERIKMKFYILIIF